jgi:hypothetical protein
MSFAQTAEAKIEDFLKEPSVRFRTFVHKQLILRNLLMSVDVYRNAIHNWWNFLDQVETLSLMLYCNP